MFEILDNLLFFIRCILAMIAAIVIFLSLAFGMLIGFNYIDYYLNKANCVVKVDKNIVYKGNSHFVELDSIGENGNTKNLKIYKDKAKMVLIKNYVSNNITIIESEG